VAARGKLFTGVIYIYYKKKEVHDTRKYLTCNIKLIQSLDSSVV